jgi:hypothetical protein
MSLALRRVGPFLPAALGALALGACSGKVASPTAVTPQLTAIAEQQPTYSITVQGQVVDSANQPVANAEVECMGDVQCGPFGAQVTQEDGPDDGVKTNAAGAYLIVVKRFGGGGPFSMSASARGFEPTVQQSAFPDPTCSSDRAGCAVTLNFTLVPRAD